MKCILSDSKDPFFNLAVEEYLLKHFDEDFYFQYTNKDSVIIGKHQNALAEINIDYLNENNILLARRISGGGAVFHDHGNVNYAFITNETSGDFIKFKTYTTPIISALKRLGITANLGKRNEILVGKEKISGTASHVFKNRVLHHGTLLFNADLEKLGKCLYVNSQHFSDKAVKSVRSTVVNIQQLLNEKLEEKEFYDFLFSYILHSDMGNEIYNFSPADQKEIEKLSREKFMAWEWRYAYSPKYAIEREIKFHFGFVKVSLLVLKGIISELEIETKHIESGKIASLLIGTRHDKKSVMKKLQQAGLESGITRTLVEGLF